MITGLVAAQLCAACSSGDDLIVPDDNLHPISFSTADTSAQVTRADNTVGLNTLGITEIKVYGYKTLTDGDGKTTLQNVMPGYTLKYVDGTANSSTSNTTGWEYVGLTDKNGEAIKDYTENVQEIKYWDGNSKDYRFFGVINNSNYTLKYDGKDINEKTTVANDKSFSMEFDGLTYMTRRLDPTDKDKYIYYAENSTSDDKKVDESSIPMYGSMWQGNPSASGFDYTKPVILAFTKPYALIRIVFVRPDGSSVTQLGDNSQSSKNPYSATFKPKLDNTSIQGDGKVSVSWSMDKSQETTDVTPGQKTIAEMQFDPIELSNAEKRYQAWPEYLMIPSKDTTSEYDYVCTVFVKASTSSNGSTTTNVEQRTAFVPKEFTHWKAGYEYTYVFKITYNNSLEFSHVVETYTKWQAGYVNETKW